MSIPVEHAHRYAYHFTSIENLPGILEHGLLSYNEMRKRKVEHLSVAEDSIQVRRSRMAVKCGPGGVVHDYVPFYFCKRTSMLQAVIFRKNVDQQFLIYIAVTIDWVNEDCAVFTDASANTECPPGFYAYCKDLCQLKWDLIDSLGWRWNDEQKQARMAELLIHRSLPVDAFTHIITWNRSISKIVRKESQKAGIRPPNIFENARFYYTRYSQDKTRSLITGPYFLEKGYREVVEDVLKTRGGSAPGNPAFDSIEDSIACLKDNFCRLPELAEIDDLRTANPQHHEDVGSHSRRVVENISEL